MPALRRLSLLSLVLAFAQIVFGAIVRITGSGMGCGDHWPDCAGYLFPPLSRPDLIIEVSHRFIAAALTVAIVALVTVAIARRAAPGVGGRGGVLRSALLAGALVIAAALLGAVTVKMRLDPFVIVAHLSIAMTLLAVLVVAAMRAGWLAGVLPAGGRGSGRTMRAAVAAAGLTFAVLILGALTANVPGAAGACVGFPGCREMFASGAPLAIQITHRVLAGLLLLHLTGVTLGVTRRREARAVVLATRVALGAVLAQIVVAAAMVELRLPAPLQSLHQAVGTLVWLSTFTLAVLARSARRGADRAAAAVAAKSAAHSVAVIVARGADL